MAKINPCKKKDTRCHAGKYLPVPCSALGVCKQRYLWPLSSAVKSHNAKNFGENKFQGCQNIEEFLIRERLVGYSLKESLTKYPAKNENKKFDLWADDPSKDGSGCPRCEKDRETLIRGVKRCLKLLTNPQLAAVEKYYMKNNDGKTKAEVAAKLGISKDSLQDRLNYAEKKIRNFFKGVDLRISCSCKVNFHEPYELITAYGEDLDEYLRERSPDLSKTIQRQI